MNPEITNQNPMIQGPAGQKPIDQSSASSSPVGGLKIEQNKNNKKCKHLPIIIILAIVAVAGIGFGGYEFWQDSQKDVKITELEKQNQDSKKMISDLQNQIETLNNKINDYNKNENNITPKPDESANISGQVVAKSGDIEFHLVSGEIYVKDVKNNKIIDQTDDMKIAEVESCDSGTASSGSPLKCTFVSSNGRSWFTYDSTTGAFKHGKF